MTRARPCTLLFAGLSLAALAAPTLAAPSMCKSGWTGTVSYSRHQSNSNDKTQQRVSGNGTETSNWTMQADYDAQVTVRTPRSPAMGNAIASISASMSSSETKSAQDRYACAHKKGTQAMSGNFTSTTTSRGSASGVEADVGVTENDDGSYSVSVGLPDIQGTVSGSDSASFGGQCNAREAKANSLSSVPTTIEGHRFSSEGYDRLDPASPDRASGSHSVSNFGVTETLRWNLKRCSGALRLVEVRFEDMKFPTWGAWQKIDKERGTIDGNKVRVTAVVANDGPEEAMPSIHFRETFEGDRMNAMVKDSLLESLSTTIPSGEEREVQFEWDSSGYAWFDDGRPRLQEKFKVEVEDKGKVVDRKTEPLKVAPKPLVLVHGLWSDWHAWSAWQNILTTSHSYDWKAFAVGEKPQMGEMNTGREVGYTGATNTIAQNAVELERYVKYAQRDRNAWHVDLVAHSMGGLISRRYIHSAMPMMPDGKPLVEHLVMLGTPNMGSRCADLISPPLEMNGNNMHALRELRPSVVAQFNAANAERKGVEFSVLAGDPLPTMCYMFEANDGVVAVTSAQWTVSDTERQGVIHTDMATPAGFSSFVKPRIAIGPGKKASPRKTSALGPRARALPGAPATRLMLIVPLDPDADNPADFSTLATVPARGSIEIDLHVRTARNLGITLAAPPSVSARLVDPDGNVVAENLAGTPAAAVPFRSLFVDRATSADRWRLLLRNEADRGHDVVVASWSQAE